MHPWDFTWMLLRMSFKSVLLIRNYTQAASGIILRPITSWVSVHWRMHTPNYRVLLYFIHSLCTQISQSLMKLVICFWWFVVDIRFYWRERVDGFSSDFWTDRRIHPGRRYFWTFDCNKTVYNNKWMVAHNFTGSVSAWLQLEKCNLQQLALIMCLFYNDQVWSSMLSTETKKIW